MDEKTKRRRMDAVLTSDLPWAVRAALAAHHPGMDDETIRQRKRRWKLDGYRASG